MSLPGMMLYRSRGSWAESLDPRAKLVFVALLFVDLIIDHRPWWMLTRFGALVLLWAVSRLPWRLLGYMLLSLGLLFGSTMLYHTLIAAVAGPTAGAVQGLTMCLQIAGLTMLLAFQVATTPPLVLAEGMESLLGPLKRVGVPVHAGVMIFTIALRFLPIVAGEFAKVRTAQIARGAGFHRRSLPHRIRGVLPMLVPVIVASLMRADELATAMDARCYRGDVGRTPLRVYRFTPADWAMVAVAAGCLISGLVYRL
jgi:energy-coupling factor transport system permease protein